MLANADSIHRLIATLGSRNSDSTLVVSLRDTVSQLRALYAQRLRNWDSPSYSTWILKLRELENEMPLGGPLPRRLNLHRVPAIWPFRNALASFALSEWLNSSSRWTVATVPFQKDSTAFLTDFFSACRLRVAEDHTVPGRLNTGLTACQVFVLSQVRMRQRRITDYWSLGGEAIASLASRDCTGGCVWIEEPLARAVAEDMRDRECERLIALGCEPPAPEQAEFHVDDSLHEGSVPGVGAFFLCSPPQDWHVSRRLLRTSSRFVMHSVPFEGGKSCSRGPWSRFKPEPPEMHDWLLREADVEHLWQSRGSNELDTCWVHLHCPGSQGRYTQRIWCLRSCAIYRRVRNWADEGDPGHRSPGCWECR